MHCAVAEKKSRFSSTPRKRISGVHKKDGHAVRITAAHKFDAHQYRKNRAAYKEATGMRRHEKLPAFF
jgi:hypothetical protein